MIDSDLADSDLGTRRGVHLIERKRRKRAREGRARRIDSGKEIAGRRLSLFGQRRIS